MESQNSGNTNPLSPSPWSPSPRSKIVITDNFEKAVEEIGGDLVYLRPELKMEEVREIQERVYLKGRGERVVVIGAEKYNIYVQNGLLKLLEEPPEGVAIILLARDKYQLLETIRSRLPIERRFFHRERPTPKEWSRQEILELLGSREISKEEAKEFIYSLFREGLGEEELKSLGEALRMVELNIDWKGVISWLYLKLLRNRKR
jgi:DNA polymerase-3 subunit delta'